MGRREFLAELAYPAASTAALTALLTFMLLFWLASAAGLFGIWLNVVTVPAFLRYLTMIAEARAQGRDAAPPGIGYFSLAGNVWTLFPVIPVLLVAYLVRATGESYGAAAAAVPAVLLAVPFPALVGVLVITHSPLQSIDPRAIGRFISRSGRTYWFAPPVAVTVVAVPMMLDFLPGAVSRFAEVYLAAAFFAVTGAVTRGSNLLDDIELPVHGTQATDEARGGQLRRQRTKVLDHAYGFVSRGNRDGGLEHIYRWLEHDPDPDAAWPWFLDQMLAWQDNYPGLLLAQRYLGRLLARGDAVAAVKLMLRCRLLDERFRPLGADLPAAIAAAEACNNGELAAALSRRR